MQAAQGIGKEVIIIHSLDSYFGGAFLELFQIKIEMQKRLSDRDNVGIGRPLGGFARQNAAFTRP
jgi:hypothetical protein